MKKIVIGITGTGTNVDKAADDINQMVVQYLKRQGNVDGFIDIEVAAPKKEIQIPMFMLNRGSR